jgi:hypothetical protein
MLQHGHYKCPLCQKPLIDISAKAIAKGLIAKGAGCFCPRWLLAAAIFSGYLISLYLN